MIPEEAIEIIDLYCGHVYKPKKMKEAFDMAIEALKEVQWYRKVGTVDECREAREKRKPKNPEIYTDTRAGMDLHDRPYSRQVDVYLCPSCGSCIGYVGESISSYCPDCGQAIQQKL